VGTQHYVGALGPLCYYCADTVREGPAIFPSGLAITPHPAAHRIGTLEAEVERLKADLRGCDAGRSLLHRQVERLESELREADAYRLTDEEWKKRWRVG
jgi:uncharacterized small protein (DUF1192 family)